MTAFLEKRVKSGPSLDETDPTLLWLLRRAFDEWGVAGVVSAAKLLAESDRY